MAVAQLAAAPTLALELEPARAATAITVGLPAGAETVTLWRNSQPTGHFAYVRGYVEFDVSNLSTLLAYDWEVPLGIDVDYHASVVVAGVESAVATARFRVDDERDWLTDLARPTNTFPVLVDGLPQLAFDGPVGIHRVLDRRDPVLTTGILWTPTGTLTFVTSTEDERDRARTILGAGVAFLLRTPPRQGVGNLYLGATSVHEQRPSRIAYHWDRAFVVDVVQVARPDASIFVPVAPLTFRDLLATWPTYRALGDTGETYQGLLYTFDGVSNVDPYPPWLPDDV